MEAHLLSLPAVRVRGHGLAVLWPDGSVSEIDESSLMGSHSLRSPTAPETLLLRSDAASSSMLGVEIAAQRSPALVAVCPTPYKMYGNLHETRQACKNVPEGPSIGIESPSACIARIPRVEATLIAPLGRCMEAETPESWPCA